MVYAAINSSPYSIIFKLAAPIPADVVVGDELWLAQEVSGDYPTEITLTPPDLKLEKEHSNKIIVTK